MDGRPRADIIIDEPNFLFQAIQLMVSYYERDRQESEERWIDSPLIRKLGNFIIPEAELNARFSDVIDYLRHVRREGAAILRGCHDLEDLFALAVRDEKGESGERFFGEALTMMTDAKSAADLSRDAFVKGCLWQLADLSELPEDILGDEERMADYLNPDYHMGEIFSRVNASLFDDLSRMALLRFFQDADRYHALVGEKLLGLEEVCRRHFPRIEGRCAEKARLYKEQGEDAAPLHWMRKLVADGESLRSAGPVHIVITPVRYNSLGLRMALELPLNKQVYTGIIFDELNDLQNRGESRREETEKQLRAIADPTRLNIIRLLSLRRHYVQEMADELGLTPATLSHHLKALMQTLLVTAGVEGRRSYYSLSRDTLKGLAEDLGRMADMMPEEES